MEKCYFQMFLLLAVFSRTGGMVMDENGRNG
nr:MAG TPA_asm: hypothetical protein [Caudoviricetes sp.]